ncbi:uncharacterized protein LOC110047107 [Orbicella faveolata]|uniref:uncharacterized protein LOC110047107 n=1 Tax=Orbicella faveolata TaxID=48498 RepID=UPI0009E4B99E|nr:uncharacterized protein LOC110047107 [Orbicella faveolata]
MHRDNFGGLFVVVLTCASFEIASSVPVDASALASVRTEITQKNNLARKYSPGISQFAEKREEYPATFLDDPRLGSTSPERKVLLKRLMMEANDRSPFIEPENDILDRAESTVLQKRIFYDGRRGSPSFPDTNIPKRPGNEILNTRRMYGRPLHEDVRESDAARHLETLLSLRDRARAIHEQLNDSIERYRHGTKAAESGREHAQVASEMKEQEEDERMPDQPGHPPQAQEWDRILHGFEVE